MYFIPSFCPKFPFTECEKLYEENRKYLTQNKHLTFKELCEELNGNLWAVYAEDKFIGVIYFGFKEGKWFLSGFSIRHAFKFIQQAINDLCEIYFKRWNIKEIYSETIHKHAKLALKRAGFKQISDTLYRKEAEK